jgi:hypothetical protein
MSSADDRFAPIVLKKSFSLMTENSEAPLVRLTRCDVRDHINCRKNNRWSSYRFYKALQRLKSPTCDICEIFGAPRFRGFSTQSANSGHSITAYSANCALSKDRSFANSRPEEITASRYISPPLTLKHAQRLTSGNRVHLRSTLQYAAASQHAAESKFISKGRSSTAGHCIWYDMVDCDQTSPEDDHRGIAEAYRKALERLDNPPWLYIVHDINPGAVSPKVKDIVSPQSWFVDLTLISVQ